MLIRQIRPQGIRGLDAAMFVMCPKEVLFWLKYQGHPRKNEWELRIECLEVRGETVKIGIEAPKFFRICSGEKVRGTNLDFEHHAKDAWEMVSASRRKVSILRSGINQLVEDGLCFSDEAKFRQRGVDRWTEEEAIAFSRSGDAQFVVLAYLWLVTIRSGEARIAWRMSLDANDFRVTAPKVSNIVKMRN